MLKTVTKNTFFLQLLYIIYYYKILSLLFLYFIQMLNKRQKAMITQRQRHYSMTKQKRQKQYFIEMLNKRQKAMITRTQRHYSMTKQKGKNKCKTRYFISKTKQNLLKNINILI